MKIESFSISMASEHNLTEFHAQTKSLRLWIGNRGNIQSLGNNLQQQLALVKQDVVDISDRAKNMFKYQVRNLGESSGTEDAVSGLSDMDRQRIQLIQDFVYALTGKRIRISVVNPSKSWENSSNEQNIRIKAPNSQPGYGWGMIYNFHKIDYEQEQTNFSAAGVVKTADGRTIDFSLSVGMSREFMSEQNINIRAGDAIIDPLVINFGGHAADLTETKYSFDLDSDGTLDQISFVSSGSGFLALDLNADGKINNGSELFGPQSGNGFGELSRYDSDNNGWIDENDPIYDKLRIWTKDAEGNDQLFALGQKGIGAIYLGNIATPFSIKSGDNELKGQVQRSGVFLNENGTVGSIQQVDLAI